MRLIVQQLAILAFLAFQTGCASVPGRADLPAEETPYTIHLVQYGWHTALLFDGPSFLSLSTKLGSDFHGHRYLLIGWGDGEYFVAEYPPWSKAVKALIASDYPALQVAARETNPPFGVEARDSIPLAITERGYHRLIAYIDRSIAVDADGKPLYLGQQDGNPDHHRSKHVLHRGYPSGGPRDGRRLFTTAALPAKTHPRQMEWRRRVGAAGRLSAGGGF
jgi:hypothetical protein